VLYGRYGLSVSAPKNHFSWETETDLTRDWFESGGLMIEVGSRHPLLGRSLRARC
jgi:hypothetical protein